MTALQPSPTVKDKFQWALKPAAVPTPPFMPVCRGQIVTWFPITGHPCTAVVQDLNGDGTIRLTVLPLDSPYLDVNRIAVDHLERPGVSGHRSTMYGSWSYTDLDKEQTRRVEDLVARVGKLLSEAKELGSSIEGKLAAVKRLKSKK